MLNWRYIYPHKTHKYTLSAQHKVAECYRNLTIKLRHSIKLWTHFLSSRYSDSSINLQPNYFSWHNADWFTFATLYTFWYLPFAILNRKVSAVPLGHYVIWRRLASRGQLKCDGTRAVTGFRLSAKRTSLFKWAWVSVQTSTGSRCVCFSGSNAGHTMFRGSVKSTGYPLHSPVSPSLPLPCVTVCHHISTGVYKQ
jgi:hypothetical protein